MNYKEAKNTLNGRASRKIGNNTYIELNQDQSIGIRLHSTQVVVFYPTYAQLFTGGWQTLTTKDRLNTYAPCRISQKNNIWYIGGVETTLFYEGIKVAYSGTIISKVKNASKVENANKKIKARIKKYIDLAMVKLGKGKVNAPSGGDCWGCALKDQAGKTLGDLGMIAHLTDHFKEGYIVPSLLWNAVKEAGYKFPEIILGYDPETKKMGSSLMSEWGVKNSLKKYLQKRLLVKP